MDIYGLVAAGVPESPADGLFVVNLEGNVPSGTENQHALRSLNASRELWEERYRCPVVFWLPEYAATLLAIHAPDFWRYRSHRFEFVSEQADVTAGLADRFAGDLSAAAELSAEEKRFRIAELEQRIAEAGDPPPPELVRHVSVWLNELAYLYQFTGDLDRAEKMLRKALAIETELGRQKPIAINYRNLGVVYSEIGDLGRAEEMYRMALAIDERLGWQDGMANDYGNLGVICEGRDDLEQAEEMFHKSLAIREKRERQDDGLANDYSNLGIVYQKRGNPGRAEEMFRKALAIDERLGRHDGIASDYGNLGLTCVMRGDLDRAEEMLCKALTINRELGRQAGIAGNTGNLAITYQKRGDHAKSQEWFERARDLFLRLGNLERARAMEDALRLLQKQETPDTMADNDSIGA